MNKIILRTNKGEYFPGEEICGAVYLNISRPTAGRGVELKLYGYERFSYPSKPENFQLDPGRQPFQAYKEYIKTSWVKLYETKAPLSIGISGIPFKISLPLEIPGTFYGEGVLADIPWEARVEYTLEAQVIDANELKAKQLVVILQRLQEEIIASDPPQAVDKSIPVRLLFVFKKNLHVTARLLQNVHRAGETLYLRVIITNDTRVLVNTLHLQLLRQIKLISRKDNKYIAEYVEDWVPVGKPQEMDMSSCPKGFDRLHIPLRNCDNSSLFPSVDGFHIKCLYKLDIQVTLSNNDVINNFQVPVPVIICEKNKEWLEWFAPDWLPKDGKLQLHIETGSNFSVPKNVLQTEPFSTVPGIQKL